MTEMTERREATRIQRAWWTVSRPGRLARFRRWRRSTREVTRGFLLFRDVVLLTFTTAIVVAGISVLRDLRAADCRSANARREDIKQVALKLVANDKYLIEFMDDFIPDGLPADFRDPLLARYRQQVAEIEEAFKPAPCPGDAAFNAFA